MQNVIGWIALIIFGIILIAQFYVYYGVRRVIDDIAQKNSDDLIASEASEVKGKSARAKLKWLRSNKSSLSTETMSEVSKFLWVDTLTFLIFGLLILLWVIAMLL